MHTVTEQRLTVAQTERAVAKQRAKVSGTKRCGAPVTVKRFFTTKATVTLTFRRKFVTIDDILTALEEARAQFACQTQPTEARTDGSD